MKKENFKIFGICFLIIYGMISALCILSRQPLVFAPEYSIGKFIFLSIFWAFYVSPWFLCCRYLKSCSRNFLPQFFLLQF